jgi:hypothetical protein
MSPPNAPPVEPSWLKYKTDEMGIPFTAETVKPYIVKWRDFFATDDTLGNLTDAEIVKILTNNKGGGKRIIRKSRKQRKSRKSRKSRKQRRTRRRM